MPSLRVLIPLERPDREYLITATLRAKPQSSYGGALLGADQDDISCVALAFIIEFFQKDPGGGNVIGQHRIVIRQEILQANAVFAGRAAQAALVVEVVPEVIFNGGAVAMTAK